MHELSTVQGVIYRLKKSGRKRARLRLGAMVMSKDNFLDAFQELVKGTDIEKVKLEVEQVPAIGACDCGFEGAVEVPEHVHFLRCPDCGSVCRIKSGMELEIV